MTNQDVRSALKSLDQVFPLLDKLNELGYFLEAMDIMSCNLLDYSLNDYWHETDRESAYKRFSRVHTQLTIIKEFSKRSKKFLDGYEESLRDKLCPGHDILTELDRELSEDKSLDIHTNETVESCNMVTVDNYHLWE